MEFNIVNFRINLPLDGKERAVRSAASVDVKPARKPDVKHTVKQDSKPEPKVKPEEKKSPPKPKESQIKVEPATPKQLSPKKAYFPHLIIIIMKNTIFFMRTYYLEFRHQDSSIESIHCLVFLQTCGS